MTELTEDNTFTILHLPNRGKSKPKMQKQKRITRLTSMSSHRACALFFWLISHQSAVLFSHNKPAITNQPAVLFSQNKPVPAISHQLNEQTDASVASPTWAPSPEGEPPPVVVWRGRRRRRI
jgi:hypothetical protein